MLQDSSSKQTTQSPPSHTPSELRQAYLDFFEARGHTVVPSSSIVPENDPTTLFTGSGMQPMVPYLLGEAHPEGTRIVDSQKCFRSQDIEDVGDNRHTTYFEMLGNWSLGDYFKAEQLEWIFTFLTQEVGLDPQRIYVTVYEGNEELGIPRDDEAVQLWQDVFATQGITATALDDAETQGLRDGRIFYYGDSENWWSRVGVPENMPVGEPGGPDSEIFFDLGADHNFHERSEYADQPCHVSCDCGRFLEIGNNVFMTYRRTEEGFEPLAQKNIDFGGGLERILAAQQDTPDVFLTGFFQPLIETMGDIMGTDYATATDEERYSLRVIADHVRAAVMLAADGVVPDSQEQGYFARRLLRRAIRHAQMVGVESDFLAQLVAPVVQVYADAYSSVAAQQEQIEDIFAAEEEKFARALRKGMAALEDIEELSGEVAFDLYQTYGFPYELTQEIAQERDQDISRESFEAAKQAHAEASRQSAAGKFSGGLADQSEQTTQYHTATHLLHAALHEVLGEHAMQAGSNITAERLRFDFSHDSGLTDAEIEQIETLVNTWIEADLPVHKQTMSYEEAVETGAVHLFNENYPDTVSVYSIGSDPSGEAGDASTGWISKEFCGGPHVERTGVIGPVEIYKEKSAGAGVRRVYMRTAATAA